MHYTRSEDPEIQAIAVLHDVVEDSNITFDILRMEGMSERVIRALQLLTHKNTFSYMEYIGAIKTNPDATLVKLADLRHNSDIRRLKGLTRKDLKRMEKYHKAYLILSGNSTK